MITHKGRRSGRGHQAGQSLISMMIGVLISLFTIAGMMVLYKVMIDTSGNASRAALRDGQVSSALLAAQVELQQAGFGVPPGDAFDTKLAVAGKQVVWRYRTNLASSDYVCAGLRLVDDKDDSANGCAAAGDGVDQRGLYFLPPKACASASAPPAWSCPDLLTTEAAFFQPLNKDGTVMDGDMAEVGGMSLGEAIGFTQGSTACLPYMQQEDAGVPLDQVATVSLATAGAPLFTACLPNISTAVGG